MRGTQLEKAVKAIIQDLRKQLEVSHTNGYVIGMSGGLDCSLMSAICHRGKIPVYLVTLANNSSMEGLPNYHSRLVSDAFADGKIKILNIGPVVDFINDATSGVSGGNEHMAQANISPRIRMTYLYAFAQKMNYLVMGTSNLSEIVMGYFTKWGDGVADVEPIKCFTKTEVRELAKHLKMLPEILEKAPSAELWEGQTDEEEMGITYERIDQLIQNNEGTQEDRNLILKTIERNRHKTRGLFDDEINKVLATLTSSVEKTDI